MWRTNVIRHKINCNTRALEDKLFILHPIMGPTLKKHRVLNDEMGSLRFFETSSGNYGSFAEVPTLE